jgi:hypothetical protein
MKKRLLKENYRPIVTTEIRHGFLLVWMGDVGEEVLSGRAGEPDFHFDGEEAKKILRYFDRKSTDLMKAGYPVVSMAIPDEYIRIAEGKIMKTSQLKTLIKEIVKNLQLEYGGALNKQVWNQMTAPQQEVVKFLIQRSFAFARVDTSTGQPVVMLERAWGKGRHGGNRIAAVRPDGTINDGLSVRDFIRTVGEGVSEMIANKDAIPEPMGFVNVEEAGGDDKDLEKAKELANKIWGDKVGWVAFYPASSNTKYFRVDISGNAEWLAKTQTSGWIYSKNNKMISVNDLSVNEKTNPDGTYTDDMESGMKSRAYSGLKEGWAMGEYTPAQQQSIDVLGKLGFREVSTFPNKPDAENQGQDNQVVVVLQKRSKGGTGRLSYGLSCEVDPEGMCNGQPIQDFLRGGIKEQTSSGAAGGQPGGMISVPAWGTKNKEGSPRAIAATKRMKGWKVAKSISEKVK